MSIQNFRLQPGFGFSQLSPNALSFERLPAIKQLIRLVIEEHFPKGLSIERAFVSGRDANLDARGDFVDDAAVAQYANLLLQQENVALTVRSSSKDYACRPDPHYADHWIKERHFELITAAAEPLIVGEVPSTLAKGRIEIPLFARLEIGAIHLGLFVEWTFVDEGEAQQSSTNESTDEGNDCN
ncbi:MAG: hypothetical protein V3W41_21740 [Planctomycetota bacterium]